MTPGRDRIQSQEAAVSGLSRSDPRGPGITRVPGSAGFRYLDAAGTQVASAEAVARISARRAVTVGDPAVVPAVRSLARSGNGLDGDVA